MKKATLLITLVALSLSMTTVCAQHKVRPFEHMSISVNTGSLGAGVQLAAPINQHLSLRTGFTMLKYTYNYDYKEVIYYEVNDDYSGDYNMVIPMKAKANMVNALLLADIFPFHNKRFHVTGGFYVGSSDIIKVSADVATRPVEIGDVIIYPGANGRVAAQLETKGFKPYVGIGFGSSVTKQKRVGFKFELGAMFQGSPKIVVTEGELLDDEDLDLDINQKLNDVNKFLKDFSVYPVLNFQLNFRMF